LNPHLHIWKIFWLDFLKCSETPLVHQQISLPIFEGGIGLDSTKVIAPTMFLGSLGAYCPNHRIHIFVRRCLIFIEGYRGNNLGPLPFQPHFKWSCDLLPLAITTSIQAFEHLLEKGANYLQENILESVLNIHYPTSCLQIVKKVILIKCNIYFSCSKFLVKMNIHFGQCGHFNQINLLKSRYFYNVKRISLKAYMNIHFPTSSLSFL
jgi:hypothetical protein